MISTSMSYLKKKYNLCLDVIHVRRHRVNWPGWSHQEGFQEKGALCLRCEEVQEMLGSRREWRWMVTEMEVLGWSKSLGFSTQGNRKNLHEIVGQPAAQGWPACARALGRTKQDPYKDWIKVSVGEVVRVRAKTLRREPISVLMNSWLCICFF